MTTIRWRAPVTEPQPVKGRRVCVMTDRRRAPASEPQPASGRRVRVTIDRRRAPVSEPQPVFCRREAFVMTNRRRAPVNAPQSPKVGASARQAAWADNWPLVVHVASHGPIIDKIFGSFLQFATTPLTSPTPPPPPRTPLFQVLRFIQLVLSYGLVHDGDLGSFVVPPLGLVYRSSYLIGPKIGM